MLKKRCFEWVLTIIFAAGFVVSGVEEQSLQVNSILASVNGEPVSLVDILEETRNSEFQAYAIYSGKRLEEEIRKIRMKAVDDRIDRILVLEAYREKPFEIPSRNVEEELDHVAERMGVRSRSEFTRKLRESGTSIEKLRKEIEEYIIVQTMIYDQIRIESNLTPREVYEYFQSHQKEFVKPEKIGLAMILLDVNDPDLESKIKTISETLAASPEAFPELAQTYSVGPDPQNGGNLGEIERRRLRTEFAAAMDSFEPGKVYGPIRTADGVSFLRILSHTPEKKGVFRELSAEIREKMESGRREEIRQAYLNRLRSKAIIRYFF
ncbi:peptidylprolyl isomerase [uncultured Victivallis sp.]|uniref:peptidylprolyl isomerase n=1 Tax=uncultured Victivallis sp. TaxID=354118 RepID=UPI0025EEEE12|nr:peptidylprolyl isomerase [uncultured Victivallis sp.]